MVLGIIALSAFALLPLEAHSGKLEWSRDVKKAFKILYRSGLSPSAAVDRIESELDGEHIKLLVDFVRASKRGVIAHGEPGMTARKKSASGDE